MTEMVRQFTSNGVAAFSAWLRTAGAGQIPGDLLVDSDFSVVVAETDLLNRRDFRDRYDFGEHLVKLLRSLNSRQISFDRGLWAWLAAWTLNNCALSTQAGCAGCEKKTPIFQARQEFTIGIWSARHGIWLTRMGTR